jgi:uncharacterized protein (TIGR01589 family)
MCHIQAQVVSILQQQAKIEPSFSNLVWQKLEEQNPDFFRMYSIRLKLKEQIVMFNYLLEQQVKLNVWKTAYIEQQVKWDVWKTAYTQSS